MKVEGYKYYKKFVDYFLTLHKIDSNFSWLQLEIDEPYLRITAVEKPHHITKRRRSIVYGSHLDDFPLNTDFSSFKESEEYLLKDIKEKLVTYGRYTDAEDC